MAEHEAVPRASHFQGHDNHALHKSQSPIKLATKISKP